MSWAAATLNKVDPDAGEMTTCYLVALELEKIRAREALLAFNQEVSRLQGEKQHAHQQCEQSGGNPGKIETLKNQISVNMREDLRARDMVLIHLRLALQGNALRFRAGAQ